MNVVNSDLYHSLTSNISALIPSGRNGRNGASGLRIFKLRKSVNGKEFIPAQSTCHMASAKEGEGGKKASTSRFPAGANRNGKQPTPFCKPKSRLKGL